MNGITNKNRVTLIKESEIIEPLIHKIDSMTDNCII